MSIDKETPLGEVRGFYRAVMCTAFKVLRREVEKTRKKEEGIDGDTGHLDERIEIINEFESVLGARLEHSMADTPIGRAIREGESRANGDGQQAELPLVDPLTTDGIDLTNDSLICLMLELAGYGTSNHDDERRDIEGAVRTWDIATRREVYRWTKAMQLAGTPGVHIRVPARPSVVDVAWLGSEVRDAIEHGFADPETHTDVPTMNPTELDVWISRGPWAPFMKPTGQWALRFNPPEGHEGDIPLYAFEHDTEEQARAIAASINRRLWGDALDPVNTLAATALDEATIRAWLERGPWGVIVDENDEEGDYPDQWTLVWSWPANENEEPPTYTIAHARESEAREVAAIANAKYEADHPTAFIDALYEKPDVWIEGQSPTANGGPNEPEGMTALSSDERTFEVEISADSPTQDAEADPKKKPRVSKKKKEPASDVDADESVPDIQRHVEKKKRGGKKK